MSRIKGKNTKPEMIIRKFLFANGYRYRLHSKKLPGKPDIVLRKYNTIIDVRGCFWHLHAVCKFGKSLSTPSEVITKKRESAVIRDAENVTRWKQLGWKVIVVWADCELEPRKKNSQARENTLLSILKKLKIENTNN